MADWATISALATAGGTLVLAGATFASVRSANRAARVAERSLLLGLRPLLVPSRLDDPPLKVGYSDDKWVLVPGSGAVAEVGDGAVYLAVSLRNAGTGVAVLHGWRFFSERRLSEAAPDHAPLEEFTRLTRDLYIPVGDLGFWQGTFRDPRSDAFAEARAAIEARRPFTIELLYGDFEGGQRMISRFGVVPRGDEAWLAAVARHWVLDGAAPR